MSERLRRWQRLVAGLLQKPSLEGRCRLSSSFAYFIRFEGPLDNVGYEADHGGQADEQDHALFAPYGKLRLGMLISFAIGYNAAASHGFANQPNFGRLSQT